QPSDDLLVERDLHRRVVDVEHTRLHSQPPLRAIRAEPELGERHYPRRADDAPLEGDLGDALRRLAEDVLKPRRAIADVQEVLAGEQPQTVVNALRRGSRTALELHP